MPESGRAKRPALPLISEEMKRASSLLCQELLQWPGVSVRPMFGLRACYRGAEIFAMLPDKRALENPNAIAYKLPAGRKPREGRKWRLYELEGDRNMGDALACLDKAYRRAALPARK
jgi:hypothetical protein